MYDDVALCATTLPSIDAFETSGTCFVRPVLLFNMSEYQLPISMFRCIELAYWMELLLNR